MDEDGETDERYPWFVLAAFIYVQIECRKDHEMTSERYVAVTVMNCAIDEDWGVHKEKRWEQQVNGGDDVPTQKSQGPVGLKNKTTPDPKTKVLNLGISK